MNHVKVSSDGSGSDSTTDSDHVKQHLYPVKNPRYLSVIIVCPNYFSFTISK